ncbi:MAG: efflux RND transporter permease subunit [Spirochaetia bacterium]
MKITETAVKHPVTTSMVFLALFVLGIISLGSLGLDLFPDITMPTVAVITTYPGVSPYEIESSVTEPIEEVLSTVTNVDQISSTSSEGFSMVIVNFTSGTDIDAMLPDMREKLNEVEDDFPEGVQSPQLFKYNPEFLPILGFNVFTETEGIDTRRLAEELILPEIEKIEGVGQVSIFGGRVAAIMCELDVESISKLNIPITQVLRAFEAENITLPGGSIFLENRNVVLRTVGEFETLQDIEYVLVGYSDQVPVYLGDVATVSLDYLPQEEFVQTSGTEGVYINVRKQPGHNTVDINDRVLETLDELQSVLPPSVEIQIQTDQSISIVQSIGGVANAAWQGGLLAIVVLLLFLRNVRSTMIISVVIPISVIATFALMSFANLTINIVSLMGITLGIGMFVDNAIVVLESAYRKQLGGFDAERAAVEGTQEVGKAITASTLTTVAVFLPMLFVEGMAGLLFRDLTYTVSFALTVSLAVALSFTPVMCAKLLHVRGSRISKDKDGNEKDLEDLSLADVEVHTGNRVIDWITAKIQHGLIILDDVYEKALRLSLKHGVIIIGSAVLLLGLSVGSILLLGMEFIPETDEGNFAIQVETRIGSPFEYTSAKVAAAEQIIMEYLGDSLKAMTSQLGSGANSLGVSQTGSHLATINVAMVQKDQRDISIWEAINHVTDVFEDRILDAEFTFQVQGMSSLASNASGGTSPITLEFSGDDLDELFEYTQEVAEIVRSVEGTRDVQLSHQPGKPEIQLRILREQALSLGLSPLEIAATIRTAFKGSQVSRFRMDETDYDVMIMLEEEDRDDLLSLDSLFFVNRMGSRIPLLNVVDIVESLGPVSISRRDRTRLISVSCSLTGNRVLSDVITDITTMIDEQAPLPVDIERTISGASAEMDQSFSSLFNALLLAVGLVYMVMASQFESLLHPFIVMFSIPFAIIGMVAALLITNTTFNIIAFVGCILLVGIVVNNAIVLIDYINILRKRGLELKKAIVKAGKTRLKPILMTSATTILGLLPMALGIGTGAELRSPMGRAIVGGLTTSTLVTLILIPTIYWLVETKLRRKKI